VTRTDARSPADDLARRFAALPHTPLQHFTLYLYGAVLRVAAHALSHFGTPDVVHERLPFLVGYLDELASLAGGDENFLKASACWRDGIDAWEKASERRLPLAELRKLANLTHDDVTLLAQIGLPDEDPRFGHAFDLMQGGIGERRATAALLGAGWSLDDGFDARGAVERLRAIGLVERTSVDTNGLRPCALVWDAMRSGSLIGGDGARHRPLASLPGLDALVLSPELRTDCETIPDVIASGAASAIVLRGPRHNGRSTIAYALAARMGKAVLEVSSFAGARDPRWRTAASLACLLDAVLLTTGDPGPSETFELPDLPESLATIFVILGTSGGVSGALADRAITLAVPIPTPDARATLWRDALGSSAGAMDRLRLTSGNIVRAARVARAMTAWHRTTTRDAAVDEGVLRSAIRSLERPGIEALARRVEASGDWTQLAASAETYGELTTLAARCRQRERLAGVAGTAFGELGAGVRALFKGPSGTGKTLAARLLAGVLGMDLYRVDLAAVVNKYIGETEKNLERVFACAEELDIILLLDEGDALMTHRTGVQNANDRYANLETNYLLQRLESYEGILLVTTNAGERIDGAFQRRMDVVIDFPLPDASERWSIWQLHLPQWNAIDPEVLSATAQRCALTGGQIRNVALHAALLAVESDGPVDTTHLETAIEREYRRQGGQSPLRVRSGVR